MNNEKWNKSNEKPRSQFSSSKSPSRTKQVWLRKDKAKGQVVFNAIKAKSSSELYLDSGYTRHMRSDKTYFTSLENYNGGIVTFRDGSLARVKGKGSMVILGCPKLNKVLYVEGLKANLLSISKMHDKDHRVNFYQDLCEPVNKKGKVVITRHMIVDNCYVINPNFRTPLMCSMAKLDSTKLGIEG